MTTTERHTVTIEVRLGYPALVGAAWVTAMGLDPPLVCLGVDDPGGHRTTTWYAPGNVLMAGGHRWRVLSTSAPPRPVGDAVPGALGEHTVAVLIRLDDEPGVSGTPRPRGAPRSPGAGCGDAAPGMSGSAGWTG